MVKKILVYGLAAAILAVPVMSLAMEWRAGDQPSVRSGERIADDIYIMGNSVTSAGIIEGDLVAGGGNVVISGRIGEDIIAGGGNVTIFANVGDDVRAGGGNVVIEGRVGGDAILGGGQITLGGEGVGGDLTVGGGNVRIDAPVSGKVRIASENVYINAPIAGDIKIEAKKVTLGGNAVISGNLIYKAKQELVKENGAVVKGKITFEPIQKKVSKAAFAAIFPALLLWKFFALLACAMLFGLVFRRYSGEMVTLSERRPLLEIGRGLVTLAALPIISILLFVTMVGFPLGILGLLGFAASILFSWLVAPIVLGSVVYRYLSKKGPEVSWKTILLGVVLFCLLGLVPFIGWLAQFLLMLLALGSIVALKWQIVKEWR